MSEAEGIPKGAQEEEFWAIFILEQPNFVQYFKNIHDGSKFIF